MSILSFLYFNTVLLTLSKWNVPWSKQSHFYFVCALNSCSMAFVLHTRGSCFCGQNTATLCPCQWEWDFLDVVKNFQLFVAYEIREHLLNANSEVLLESWGLTLLGNPKEPQKWSLFFFWGAGQVQGSCAAWLWGFCINNPPVQCICTGVEVDTAHGRVRTGNSCNI